MVPPDPSGPAPASCRPRTRRRGRARRAGARPPRPCAPAAPVSEGSRALSPTPARRGQGPAGRTAEADDDGRPDGGGPSPRPPETRGVRSGPRRRCLKGLLAGVRELAWLVGDGAGASAVPPVGHPKSRRAGLRGAFGLSPFVRACSTNGLDGNGELASATGGQGQNRLKTWTWRRWRRLKYRIA